MITPSSASRASGWPRVSTTKSSSVARAPGPAISGKADRRRAESRLAREHHVHGKQEQQRAARYLEGVHADAQGLQDQVSAEGEDDEDER
jgi:hypothetical protein